jgi:hypothetical protein
MRTTEAAPAPRKIRQTRDGFSAKCAHCGKRFTKDTRFAVESAVRMHEHRAHLKTITPPGTREATPETPSTQEAETEGTTVTTEVVARRKYQRNYARKRAEALAALGLPTSTRGKLSQLAAAHGNGANHAMEETRHADSVITRPRQQEQESRPPRVAIRFCPGCGSDLLPSSFATQIGAMMGSLPGQWRGQPRQQLQFRFCPYCAFDLNLFSE